MTLHDDLTSVLVTSDKLQADYAAALQTAESLRSSNALLTSSLDAANQKVADLQAALAAATKPVVVTPPVNPPAVPAVVTKFGACPANGGNVASVVTKFGKGVAVRQFLSKIAAPTFVAGVSVLHVSYSLGAGQTTREQIMQDVIAGKHDAEITAAAKVTIPAGVTLVMEIVHEADLKVSNGSMTFATAVAAKSHFYDVVKQANPKVLVANTVTGWLADPASHNDFQRWGQVKADIIGIDCDGAQAKSLPYTNYDDEIKAAKAFVTTFAKNGYKYVSVPEWGTANLATDINGVDRVKWIMEYGAKFKAAGFLYVCWYDYHMVNDDRLLLTNEINAFKSLVA